MTASTPSPTLPVTPLAASLGGAPLAAYRGALSPQRLDAPEREWSALTLGAAAHDLGWMRRVAVRGEDRFRWLSGMVTNTVNDLPAHAAAWNLVLNAQGRIQGELYVWREGSGQPSDALELEKLAKELTGANKPRPTPAPGSGVAANGSDHTAKENGDGISN